MAAMTPESPFNPEPSDLVTTQALEWTVRRLDATNWTERDETMLNAWRARSPSHEQAFQAHLNIVEKMSRPEIFSRPIRQQAQERKSTAPSSRRRWLAVCGLAAATAILGVIWINTTPSTWTQEYQTALGERREAELPDHSRITLDAMTRLVCSFDGELRRVHLVTGRALFQVSADSTRPFEVKATAQTIRVIGTLFEVKIHDETNGGPGVSVAVKEGVVEIRSQINSTAWSVPIRLVAGNAARWSSHHLTPKPAALNAQAFAAWREGHLVFDGERLSDIIADLRRHFPARLDFSDQQLGELRLSGTLPSNDFIAVRRLLETALPLRIREAGEQHFIIEPRI